MKRLRDFAIHQSIQSMTQPFVRASFDRLGIDKNGLTTVDRRYIDYLKGLLRPVGFQDLGRSTQ